MSWDRPPSSAQSTDGNTYPVFGVGTVAEAVGQFYSFTKDTGNPGAWAPGTPGLAGRATNGTLAADNGCLKIPNAVNNWLTDWRVDGANVACAIGLYDILWVNSGIVTTTTTAQTINSVSFPTVDGPKMVGLLCILATTNAGAITNMTLSYTNQDGVAGRTATVASFPATAVIGTVVWFQLAAGDTGLTSIQTIALGTSLVALNSVALIVVQKLAVSPVLAAGQPGIPQKLKKKLRDGVCIVAMNMAAVTTAVTFHGTATIEVGS